MKIPADFKKTVGFVFVRDSKGIEVPIGTGFFVNVPNEVNPALNHGYFVSAKHVFQDDKDEGWLPSIFIRLNRKDSKAELIKIEIPHHEKSKFILHDDESVDIAVLALHPSPEKYDYLYLPADMLCTREVFKNAEIGEGDDVFFLGLFTGHYGQERNYPIARFGKVALLTDEPFNSDGKLLELYLLECQSFAGNSGAPVFFYLSPIREPGIISNVFQKFLLAGVMSGAVGDWSAFKMVNRSQKPIEPENVGIAAVVPAYLLHQILFSPELVSFRKKCAKNHNKRSPHKEK